MTALRLFIHPVWVALIAVLIVGTSLIRAPVFEDKSTTVVSQIEKFSFGFQPVVADSYWLQALQSFKICNSNFKVCPQHTPTFKLLSQASRLAPDFRILNQLGPVMLSVVSSDIEGASYLFDRATMLFPNDWLVLYRASYHALAEEKNKEKAADLMRRSADSGAPAWIYSYASMLYTEAGREEFANQMIEDLKRQGVSQDIIDLVERSKTEERPGK